MNKEEILTDFKKRLDEPIPTFWKASIKLGKTTEFDYYAKVIPNQIFIRRQKGNLIQRIVKDLKSVHTKKELLIKWESKLNLNYFQDVINEAKE